MIMFECQVIIILSILLIFNKSDSSEELLWCSDGILESLIECLLASNIEPGILSWFRVACAKKAACTPKPWDFYDENIRIVKNFVECMEDMEPSKEYEQLINIDYQCRKALARNLPVHFKAYYIRLLPEGG